MPLILETDRKGFRIRIAIAIIYALLIAGGATMVYPFLITVMSSLSGKYDYQRLSPVLRAFHDRSDRYMRSLSHYFRVELPRLAFPDRPPAWGTWIATAANPEKVSAFAAPRLAVEHDPETLARWERIAADYAAFHLDYAVRDTFCAWDQRDLAPYLQGVYEDELRRRDPGGYARMSASERREGAIALLREAWEIPYRNFFDIKLDNELNYPMHHRSWDYPETGKARAFLAFKDAYRLLLFRPGVQKQWAAFLRERGVRDEPEWPVRRGGPQWEAFKVFAGRQSPMTETSPWPLKVQWLKFFDRAETREWLGLGKNERFTVEHYNRLFGAGYAHLENVPFPVPADAGGKLREAWERFVYKYYPRRLMRIAVTPALTARYQDEYRATCRTIETYNELTDSRLSDFSEIVLPETMEEGDAVWANFTDTVPFDELVLDSSEAAYQAFLLERYGSVEAVNAAYGWDLSRIEEASPPLAEASTVTFFRNEWRYFLHDLASNYVTVFDYLFIRGRAFFNTLVLIVLTILGTLTVNPLAAYALSRFKLKWTEQILLFLLATMAFPAVVTAIPGFLLMRDLGLLNTFAALVLPGIANGMSIFILKGFFDGLPRELYEAATIDGAKEWQVFAHITLPMTTPIMAVQSLSAFIAAYVGWQWALLVCQNPRYWTLSVWLYQMSQTLATQPEIIMAGFVFASVPTAIVFVSCQKIILRGIVIPSMK